MRARLSPISWLELSKETGLGSPNTTRAYVDFFEKIFVAKIVEHIDPNGRVNPRKNKKIHLLDPFLYQVVSRWTRIPKMEDTIVESVVAMHLNRITEIFYWRHKTEVDTVLKIDNKLYGFEVKWSPKPRPKKRPIETKILTKNEIPHFLATVKWPNELH
ncbi:MAG: DUF4143 domain-containing protein [Candidatus Njordarchaeia archaeon]